MANMQSYANYPYYGQSIYQQSQPHTAGPSNGYQPFPYPPSQYMQPPLRPDARDTQMPFIPPGTMTPRQKGHRRMATTPAAPVHQTLKSAMKKSTIENPLTRQQSNNMQQQPPPLTRSRTYSNGNIPIPATNPDFRPYHMFMLFIGNNELRLENIMKPAMDELRQSILPMWPDGVESDSQHGHDWTVRFRNSPWAVNGPNSALAYKIVVELFTLFARRGFAFQTCINTGNPVRALPIEIFIIPDGNFMSQPPRLIFEVTAQDFASGFFLAYFSQGGRRLTLINPPTTIDISLGAHLKAVLPRKIASDEATDENLRVIEVKRKNTFGASEVEPALFLMHILKIVGELGFELVTAVPLGRRGPLGIRAGRELLVFRGHAG